MAYLCWLQVQTFIKAFLIVVLALFVSTNAYCQSASPEESYSYAQEEADIDWRTIQQERTRISNCKSIAECVLEAVGKKFGDISEWANGPAQSVYLAPLPVYERYKIIPFDNVLPGVFYEHEEGHEHSRTIETTVGGSIAIVYRLIELQLSAQYKITLGERISFNKKVRFTGDSCTRWEVIVRKEWRYGIVQSVYRSLDGNLTRDIGKVRLLDDVHLDVGRLC